MTVNARFMSHTLSLEFGALFCVFLGQKKGARSEAFCVVSLGGGCDQVNGEAILIKLLQLE